MIAKTSRRMAERAHRLSDHLHKLVASLGQNSSRGKEFDLESMVERMAELTQDIDDVLANLKSLNLTQRKQFPSLFKNLVFYNQMLHHLAADLDDICAGLEHGTRVEDERMIARLAETASIFDRILPDMGRYLTRINRRKGGR